MKYVNNSGTIRYLCSDKYYICLHLLLSKKQQFLSIQGTNLMPCWILLLQEGEPPHQTQPPTACCWADEPRCGRARCWSVWPGHAQTSWERRLWGSRTEAHPHLAGSLLLLHPRDEPKYWHLQIIKIVRISPHSYLRRSDSIRVNADYKILSAQYYQLPH